MDTGETQVGQKADLAGDWSNVDERMAAHILQQGEKVLAAQVQLAIAADQRAMSSANMFVTVAVGVAAATLGYHGVRAELPVLIAGMTCSGLMLVAAGCCFFAAKPQPFHLPGAHPRSWWDIRHGRLVEAMGGESENCQEQIDHNERVLKGNARWLRVGLATAIEAPVVAVMIWAFPYILG